MKLTAFIMLVTCLQTSATGIAQQTITFSGKEVSLENVFAAIKKQTNYKFFFNIESIHHARAVTIDVKNASIEQVLNVALKDQPFTYTIKGRTVFIIQKKEEEKSSSSTISVQGDPVTVTGRVVDDQGQPLVGANVKIKGTSIGVTTDKDGLFKLTNVEPDATLEISFVGHETQVIPVRGKSFFAVNLAQKLSLLDETVVIAYGTTTRRLNTGNVGSVKAFEIEKQPINNPLLALQGRVPGLYITQANGLPGTGVTVRIEGQNSISKGNDPLYVIDGVPYISQSLSTTLGSILQGSGGPVINGVASGNGNPLSYINPADIEKIEVLKDADATAIYGSRASNGAILIVTKRGKAGKTKFDINVRNGWGKVTRKLHMLNTTQYLNMRHEALKNDGLAIPSQNPNATSNFDITFWDSTQYTDWQKVLIGGTSKYIDANSSISGGTSNLQYLLGGTFHRETTVFPGDLADAKGSFHFSLNGMSANQKFKFQLTTNYLVDDNRLIQSDLTNLVYQYAPDAPTDLYNSDGTLNWAPNASGTSTWFNPLKYLLQKYRNKTYNLISNAVVGYQILPGLDIKSSFGYTDMRTKELLTTPLTSYAPERRATSLRIAQYGNDNINSWIIEPQINYTKLIGNGRLEALIGTTIQQNHTDGQQITGLGYSSDQVLEDIKSAPNLRIGSTTASIYKYNAIFGRVNFNWEEKYIINLTARRDGSSRYGEKFRFHNFSGTGIGWIFSKESFIYEKLHFLSFGKLRASYGTTGNDQIGDYQFLNLYSPLSVSVPYQGASSITPNGLLNPYYHWEETKKIQVGLDIGLFSDRILLTANYYHHRSSNQILSYAVPIITGFTDISAVNFPATIQNSGVELSLTTTNFKIKDFSWTSNFNITIPSNKLVKFPNLATSTYSQSLIIGKPITITYLFNYFGVDPTTGSYQFTDKNGNNTSNPSYSTDRTTVVNTAPKFFGGFSNNFYYKGFQLDVLFQFVKQIGTNTKFGYTRTPGSTGSFGANQPVSVLNRWQKIGDITTIQRFNSNSVLNNQFSYAQQSNAAYSDASFVRLKNISISWQLPAKLLKKSHLQNCQIYLQGQNLLTITNYDGLDPENKSISSLPPLKIVAVGLQLGL